MDNIYINKNKAQYLEFLKNRDSKKKTEERIDRLERKIAEIEEKLNLLQDNRGIGATQ
jgi:hypothetical protein